MFRLIEQNAKHLQVRVFAELKDKTLFSNGQSFGEREEMPASMKAGQADCLKGTTPPAEATPERSREDGTVRLAPAKSFEKDLLADTRGKPLFKTPYDNPKHRP